MLLSEVILKLEAVAGRLRELSDSTISDNDAFHRGVRDASAKLRSTLIR